MTPEAREALEASIAHWRQNRDAERWEQVEIHSASCPLCDLFSTPDGCAGCPVRERTGRNGCQGTPWRAVAERQLDTLGRSLVLPHDRALMQDMIDFLVSLQDETPRTLPLWPLAWLAGIALLGMVGAVVALLGVLSS